MREGKSDMVETDQVDLEVVILKVAKSVTSESTGMLIINNEPVGKHNNLTWKND